MGGPAPARKAAPAKRAPVRKAPAKAPAAPVADLSLNQWLHDVATKPRRIEVFDRWWEFKAPTTAAAKRYDDLLASKGIEAALASVMYDETPLDETAEPGSKQAAEFIELVNQWIGIETATEFWRRLATAVFGLGEPSAS